MCRTAKWLLFIFCLCVSSFALAQNTEFPVRVDRVTRSDDRTRIAVAERMERNETGDVRSYVDVYDVISGERVAVVDLTPFPQRISLNHDGTKLAYTYDYHETGIIDLATGNRLLVLSGAVEVGELIWNPVHDWLTYNIGIKISVADGSTGQEIGFFIPPIDTGRVDEVRWSPDGTRLALLRDRTWDIIIWDTTIAPDQWQTSQPVVHIPNAPRSSSMEWSPDGTYLAVNQIAHSPEQVEGVHIFDTSTGEALRFLANGNAGVISDVEWSPDGSRVAGGGQLGPVTQLGEGQIWIWDVESGEIVETFAVPHSVSEVFWMSNGSLFHTGGDAGLFEDGVVTVETSAPANPVKSRDE